MNSRPVRGHSRIAKYADVDRGISNPEKEVEISSAGINGGPGKGEIGDGHDGARGGPEQVGYGVTVHGNVMEIYKGNGRLDVES
jgi:hypothetical protein